MYRVVLDTVVFVRALLSPRGPGGRLLSEFAHRLIIIVSKPTAEELLRVIRRPELAIKYPTIAKIRTQQIIDLLAKAEIVEIGSPLRVVRDPKDDMFVATALAGSADFIVSEDKVLLVLGEALGIRVIDTQTLIDLLQKQKYLE